MAYFDTGAVAGSDRAIVFLRGNPGATAPHADRVAGIAYMEAIVWPIASWDDWPPNARRIFQGLRSEAGDELCLEKNLFVETVAIVQDYADWMNTNNMPKLFVDADPGSILVGRQREFCRGWPDQTEVSVVGTHFVQEDSPDETGEAIARWLGGIGASARLAGCVAPASVVMFRGRPMPNLAAFSSATANAAVA